MLSKALFNQVRQPVTSAFLQPAFGYATSSKKFQFVTQYNEAASNTRFTIIQITLLSLLVVSFFNVILELSADFNPQFS